ncbi:High-affinity zinc uptake system binding-protein ZnuA precursor [Corynebacterium ciconiae DSM 44920]|uniref:metal ABC transporter substrate-binding protein n=1 Tax=Corynebacterium ciconiae TaxID=227319 RepID=UPI0003622B63|nr:zinc ABC transporter substrate-binding protein [Corynebacterium ciconiae]WKD60730.1 High-affinity zinc uptake system binding-protein ZnuA precursor [Corynebacterium ciconiae DSM 44920]
MKKILLLLSLLVALAGCAVSPSASVGGGDESSSGPSGDTPLIYASFYPIYSLVSDIAGDYAEVRSFLPEGQDPHLWEPTPKNIKALSEADLLVVNGANMEPWLPHIHDILPDLPVLRLSDYVDLINYKGAAALGEFQYMGHASIDNSKTYTMVFGHTHERSLRGAFFPYEEGKSEQDYIDQGREVMNDKGAPLEQRAATKITPGQVYDIQMGHQSGEVTFSFPEAGEWVFVSDRESESLLEYNFVDDDGHELEFTNVVDGGSAVTDTVSFDPHSWLSVVNAKRYANAINVELGTLIPEHKKEIEKNKSSLVGELTTMEAQFKEKLLDAPRRDFVTAHNAFAYLARDYQLSQHPLQGLTTNSAPTLRVLTDSIRFARAQNIDVIYYEDGTDPKTATVVAEEINGRALPLNSMEYGGGDEGYTGYMRMNLENLYESLGEQQ